MKLNYNNDITYANSKDNLCKLKVRSETYISNDKLFELFTKVYDKTSSTGCDFRYLFINISMHIFIPIFRNGKCINIREN
jgi:hypothetical protein